MATFLLQEQYLQEQDVQQQDFLDDNDVTIRDANEKLHVLTQRQQSRRRAAKVGSFLLGCLPGVLITIGWLCALHFHPYTHVVTYNQLGHSWTNSGNALGNFLMTAAGLFGCVLVFFLYMIGMLVAFASQKTRLMALGALLTQVGMIAIGSLSLFLHIF